MLITECDREPGQDNSLPYVELCFSIIGKTLPADHGYGLYSAIAHSQEELHNLAGVSIQTIQGMPDKQGIIHLSDRSKLRIRLPGDKVPLVYPLAGNQLTIGNHSILLGIPQIFVLQPAARLRSRIVTIKGFQEPETFLAAAKRQLDALQIQGNLSIPLNEEGEPSRKAIKVKTFSVVGFSLEATDLSDEDSIKLQILGLGGKHRMGCGVFNKFILSA
jgi:CRISPR-associated protein Cas6